MYVRTTSAICSSPTGCRSATTPGARRRALGRGTAGDGSTSTPSGCLRRRVRQLERGARAARGRRTPRAREHRVQARELRSSAARPRVSDTIARSFTAFQRGGDGVVVEVARDEARSADCASSGVLPAKLRVVAEDRARRRRGPEQRGRPSSAGGGRRRRASPFDDDDVHLGGPGADLRRNRVDEVKARAERLAHDVLGRRRRRRACPRRARTRETRGRRSRRRCRRGCRRAETPGTLPSSRSRTCSKARDGARLREEPLAVAERVRVLGAERADRRAAHVADDDVGLHVGAEAATSMSSRSSMGRRRMRTSPPC